MEEVSDEPFRILCKRFGADVVYTEFVSVEGLIRASQKTFKKIHFSEDRPIGIQIFGAHEKSMIEATKLIEKHFSPDFIDINFGCPVYKVTDKGAGAAVLQDLPKMERLARAVVKNTSLPVTVKTRLGWDKNSIRIVEVASRLQDAGIKALAIHGRTRKQMYKGKADWEWIHKVKTHPNIEIPIIGNGDIDSASKAWEFAERYGVDGVMLGRATIGNPWIFQQIRYFHKTGKLLSPPSVTERVNICKLHIEMLVERYGERVALLRMRKRFINYFKGLKNIKSFRIQLAQAQALPQVFQILENIIEFYTK